MTDTYVTESGLAGLDFKKFHSFYTAKTREDGSVVMVFAWPRMHEIGAVGLTNTDRLIVLVSDPQDEDTHIRIKAVVAPGR